MLKKTLTALTLALAFCVTTSAFAEDKPASTPPAADGKDKPAAKTEKKEDKGCSQTGTPAEGAAALLLGSLGLVALRRRKA